MTDKRANIHDGTDPSGLDYQQVNAETTDRWVREGWQWGKPIDHEQFIAAQKGDWDIVLTPTRPVPHAWFEDLPSADALDTVHTFAGCTNMHDKADDGTGTADDTGDDANGFNRGPADTPTDIPANNRPLLGARVLGLASGGGQQIPVLTAAGAVCTVLDYSPAQLESERAVAQREGYKITTVRADMTKPLPLPDASFDLVVNPVSMCYIRGIEPVFREIFRVLKPGGVVMTGQDSGINYVVDDAEERIVRGLPYDPMADPALLEEARKSDDGVQFSHTAGEEIAAILHAGLRVTDIFEDTNGDGRLDRLGIPSFIAVRAVKD